MITKITLSHDEVMAAIADAMYRKIGDIDVIPKGPDMVMLVLEERNECALSITEESKGDKHVEVTYTYDTGEHL